MTDSVAIARLPSAQAAAAPAPALRPVDHAPAVTTSTSKARRPVWLAVHLPDWQLHAALSACTDAHRAALVDQPLAIVAADRRSSIIACNRWALERGVRVGHSLNAAIALCAQVQLLARDEPRELELLDELATECERYTSHVHVGSPNELLLEVRGSFRLFGGLESLLERVAKDFVERGYKAQLAISATAQSAQWLSRIAATPLIVRPRELPAGVGRLPISVLGWSANVELSLARFGVHTVSDLLRLPRAGLARRIGHERLRELDYAMGRFKQVRATHQTMRPYVDRLILDFEIETTGLLSAFIAPRLARLARHLVARTLATKQVRIELVHRESVTPFNIGLANATSDGSHLANLMQEQLARLSLPAPVIEIIVRVDRFEAAVAASRALFSGLPNDCSAVDEAAQARLLEQLQARLGKEAVQSLHTQADHRPERAHRTQPVDLAKQVPVSLPQALARRPLWLLETPHLLNTALGSDRLLTDPEMIEAGWFDGSPVRRSYFHVRSPRGARLWAYRDASAAWFVQGLFG